MTATMKGPMRTLGPLERWGYWIGFMGRLRRTVRVGRNRNGIRTGIEPHELSAKLNHKLPLHLESLNAELVMVGKVRVLGWSLGDK